MRKQIYNISFCIPVIFIGAAKIKHKQNDFDGFMSNSVAKTSSSLCCLQLVVNLINRILRPYYSKQHYEFILSERTLKHL